MLHAYRRISKLRRRWCSGNISGSQPGAPGSIPGRRIFLFKSTTDNFMLAVTSWLVLFEIYASVAQWIARQTSNLKVVGSTPIRGAFETPNDSDGIVLAESNYTADDF